MFSAAVIVYSSQAKVVFRDLTFSSCYTTCRRNAPEVARNRPSSYHVDLREFYIAFASACSSLYRWLFPAKSKQSFGTRSRSSGSRSARPGTGEPVGDSARLRAKDDCQRFQGERQSVNFSVEIWNWISSVVRHAKCHYVIYSSRTFIWGFVYKKMNSLQ